MKAYTEEKRIRPDVLTSFLYWSLIIILVYNVITVRIYGGKGAFFSAGPFALFGIYYFGFVLAVQKAIYIMVRLRARRSQYLNAENNMKTSLRIFAILGLFLAFLQGVLSMTIATKLFGSSRGLFQCILASLCLAFLSSQGVVRGYLQGIGYTKPIVISDPLMAGVALISGTVICILLYKYGVKVNELFHVQEFSAVYGSSGMMIGLLIGCIAGFIQIMISYWLRKNEISEFVKSGAPRYLDNKNDVLSGLRSIAVLYMTPALMLLADQITYVLFMTKKHPDIDYMINYGIFAGRVVYPVMMLVLLCCIPFIKSWNRVMARVERDELEGARERFGRLFRFGSMLVVPVSLFVFAMASTLQTSIFGKTDLLSDSAMRLGSVMIALGCISLLVSWLLNHMGKSIVIAVNLTVLWVSHAASLVIFVMILNLQIYGLILAVIVSSLLYSVISLFMIGKILRIRRGFFKVLLKPLISAATAGLIIYFLNMLFVNLIGEVLTLLLCAVIYFVLYMILMCVFMGIKTHELDRVPLGKLFYGISSAFDREHYDEEQY